MEAMLRMRLQCPYNEKESGPRTELKKTLRHRERKQKIKNYDVKAGTVTAVMWRRCCLLAC